MGGREVTLAIAANLTTATNLASVSTLSIEATLSTAAVGAGAEEEEAYVARCTPTSLDSLCKTTRFTRREIRMLYQGFKQECPSGIVTEDAFKDIFAQFFPLGDASQYAHYVYKCCKQQATSLNFEQFLRLLSELSRGSTADKVRWAFRLYDLDGDGAVTRAEMTAVASAVFAMLGSASPPIDDTSARRHVDRLFPVGASLD
ncbi:KCNIP4 [Cordylochernes scorpioides]|uniref:KCNIP4 n=1 Tax=Cordylochernes scorpioides TaxID=51811 RepID=A0ABY6LNB4_9ARAC|nr:KCNIP4 [Cordylochernes scorpioides]